MRFFFPIGVALGWIVGRVAQKLVMASWGTRQIVICCGEFSVCFVFGARSRLSIAGLCCKDGWWEISRETEQSEKKQGMGQN